MSEGSPRQITVVLPEDGTASKLVAMLRDELQLVSSSIHTARGTGAGAPGLGQFGLEVEKELFSVIVPADQADEAFRRIYEFTEMGTRHGGFMFQAELSRTHFMTLPEGEAEVLNTVQLTHSKHLERDD